VAELHAGDMAGELGALDDSPRSATVRAASAELRVLRIDGQAFRTRLAPRPDIAPKLLATLAQRLRAMLRQARPADGGA
jgi:CRP-like cAMP-binding protein